MVFLDIISCFTQDFTNYHGFKFLSKIPFEFIKQKKSTRIQKILNTSEMSSVEIAKDSTKASSSEK